MQNVSRETIEKLELYVRLLKEWNRTINLVSASSLPDVWQRHILDSAQLFSYIGSDTKSLIDFGSGAGFPGMVLAIMGIKTVTLVEADSRKCSFLREVARQTDTVVEIVNERIESLEPWSVDVVTSRALSTLDKLVEYSYPFINGSGVMLCLKGEKVDQEIAEASVNWNFDFKKFSSKTSCQGCVLRVKNIIRQLEV